MKTTLLLLAMLPAFCFGQFTQLGDDIDGSSHNEGTGTRVRLNEAGDIVAIGAPNSSVTIGLSGAVRMYEYDGNAWLLKGEPLLGDDQAHNLGASIDINAAGTVVVCGAPGYSPTSSIAGYAKVFEWNGNDWVQRGQNLNGTNTNDGFGAAVSIDASGSIVAVAGEPFGALSYVKVYQWSGTAWNQLGSDILATAAQDGFGRTIELSADGNTLVVGAPNIDTPLDDVGMMRVYEWNGTAWMQKGADVFGENVDDFFGNGVTINADGSVIAAGARDVLNASAGYVKVFEWDGANWDQKAGTMFGNTGDFYGEVNQLNAAGTVIISGTVLGEYAKVYTFNTIHWIEVDSLTGENPLDGFGGAVSVNAFGDRIAIGAKNNDDGGMQSGHVRIYSNPDVLSIDEFTNGNELVCYPNPTQNRLRIVSEKPFRSCELRTIDGRLIGIEPTNFGSDFHIELNALPSGVYLLSVDQDNSQTTVRIYKQ